MLQKLALTAASVVAVLTLTIALAAAGFAPGAPVADPAANDSGAGSPAAADLPTQDPNPVIQVDTVYVKPPPKQKTITVHRVVKSSGGDGEHEHESGGDD